MRTAKAFAPAAISSFFQIYDTKGTAKITDIEKLGAIGGGFGLQKGVKTKVTAKKATQNNIEVFINSKLEPQAKTSKAVVEQLIAKTQQKYAVTVEHKIEVPIGMGFGTSAGGALTTGLAFREAIGLPLTYNQIGKIAHVAEIQCLTGFGTVSSLAFSGGCVLVVEPGAPGICQIDRIPISPKYMVVVGFFKSKISKDSVLSSEKKKDEINNYGKNTLKAILAEPTLENFLECCWNFSQKAGFATEEICRLVESAKKAGAVGAAQNMLGEAIHAVVHEENVDSVAEAFKQTLPPQQVIVSKIDFQGARLIK